MTAGPYLCFMFARARDKAAIGGRWGTRCSMVKSSIFFDWKGDMEGVCGMFDLTSGIYT